MSTTCVGPGTFEHLSPSRFVSFSFPNPHPGDPYGDPLRIAVLDSPIPPTRPPLIAALLVPLGREADWIFSTAAGHLHLLLAASPISRLILAGNPHLASSSPIYSRSTPPDRRLRETLAPLLLALAPKSSFLNGAPQIPFISYEDGVTRITLVEKLAGELAGEMLVEDVEIAGSDHRRRLRFKRSPNLVQSQVRLLPDSSSSMIPEAGSLVQPYLAPMVASLSLISSVSKERPRALCLGVGGGALLMFLNSRLGFDVVGVEADDAVLGVAKRHFGLIESEFLRVLVGDGIDKIRHFAREVEVFRSLSSDSELGDAGVPGFHVIMVDLDSVDALSGVSAPPLEFIQKDVLMAARSALDDDGLLVVNVISLEGSFYNDLVEAFREVFSVLYELDVGNGENWVVIAATSSVESVSRVGECSFTCKIKDFIGERYMECIKRI